MGVSLEQRVEMQFSSPTWTEVAVLQPVGLWWKRGIDGNEPDACVAGPGSLLFSVSNPSGSFSPGHPNCTAGLVRGTPVRVVYTYASVDYVRWRGKLDDIDPAPGQFGEKRTRCRATSTIEDLVTEQLRAIAPQLDQTEVQLLTSIIAALPTSAQPPATSFDTAQDIYTFALDDLQAGTTALTVIKNVVQSAFGLYVEFGNGTHRYINRLTKALTLSRFAYTDDQLRGLQRPTSMEGAYNQFRLQTHAKKVGATDTEVLFSHQGRLVLAAGEAVEIWMTYQDQDNTGFTMGGTDFQNPAGGLASGTDYDFNDAEDGGGVDVTADISITADFFAAACKITIENTGAVTAYKQVLQGRGRSIKDLAPVWIESFEAMSYGVRTKEIDLRYQDDAVVASLEAARLRRAFQDSSERIDMIEFVANVSDELMREALQTEIGDVVEVSESQTGTEAIAGYVQSIEFRVSEGTFITCRLGLAPRTEDQLTVAETIEIAEAVDVDSNAPETRIDEALIDFSEVA